MARSGRLFARRPASGLVSLGAQRSAGVTLFTAMTGFRLGPIGIVISVIALGVGTTIFVRQIV